MNPLKQPNNPLLEWNRLNKTNAENALISAMFASLVSNSSVLDKFSSWLLAGTGATAALMVANADKLVPFLGQFGFKISGTILVASAIFGLLSKVRAMQCQMGFSNVQKMQELMEPIIERHSADEQKIEEFASKQGLLVKTEIDTSKVISEYSKPFPIWTGWLIGKYLKAHSKNPQIAYVLPVQHFISQSSFAFLQILSFIVFVCTTLVFVQEI